MKCYLCKGKAEISQQKGREICKECFCRVIEKRTRKYSRLNRCFEKSDRIAAEGRLAEYLVKQIVKGMPVKVFCRAKIGKEFVRKNKINKIVLKWTMDDEINNFLESILEKKKTKEKKGIKLMSCMTDREAEILSDARGTGFNKNKKNKDIMGLVEKLSKKHTHSRFSMMKNIRDIEKII